MQFSDYAMQYVLICHTEIKLKHLLRSFGLLGKNKGPYQKKHVHLKTLDLRLTQRLKHHY
jgi:hypothetical protein